GTGTDTLNLGNFVNTGTVSNVENITGNADVDTITLATAVVGGTINLAGGNDALTLGNFANSLTVSNVESITGNAGADVVTLGSALTNTMTVNLAGGTDTLI
ncbi:hypothetical protein AB4144_61025, partial [Rhizobiaceae sp. 2RAB30]